MYFHRDLKDQAIDLPAGKVVCVGRNYADHIKELNNPIPEEPLLFIKPSTSLCRFSEPLSIPNGQGECHNELELAVLIGSELKSADADSASNAIWGYALGLDLTLRDKQTSLKNQGLPWERAKAFDYSCPVSGFVRKASIEDAQNIDFSLTINGQRRQQGNSELMLLSISNLLVEASQVFTLLPGDIVMTGTPKGVGPLYSGDKIEANMQDKIHIQTYVV